MKTEPKYLDKAIVATKRTPPPQWGTTQSGYTLASGSPTTLMIKLAGERKFRRVMVWQFSNAGTCFVRINGVPYIVPDHLLPET